METTKTKGRQPAPPQTIAAMESRKAALEEEADAADSDARAKPSVTSLC